MAWWLKLLVKLAKQRGKHVWSRDKGRAGGREGTGQIALPVGSRRAGGMVGQGSTNRFPSPGAPAQGSSNR